MLVISAEGAASPTFPARKTLTAGKSIIEYSEGDEAFAQDFAARVDQVFQPDLAAAPDKLELSVDQIEQQRDDYLAAMCHYLNLAKATPRMTKTFDGFAKLYRDMEAWQSRAQTSLRNFQLWRGPDLKARLEAGQVVPRLKMSADGKGVDSNFNFTEPAEMEHWRLPVMVSSSRDTETGAALAEKKISEARFMWRLYTQPSMAREKIHMVCHETVESALVENYLWSKDRRWFCEGVANYVGYKVIEDKLGPNIARKFYDLDAQLAMYADLRSSTHLEKWAALEVQQKQNHDDRNTRQGMANYAFATEVIFKVAAKHGPDFLPKLLAEVGKTPAKKATIKTIYRAYQKLYGEDLRGYLPARD